MSAMEVKKTIGVFDENFDAVAMTDLVEVHSLPVNSDFPSSDVIT